MFKNIKDAIYWLEHLPKFREKVSLDHIKNAYNLLNIDLSNVIKVHIGGTNGKGSTQAFINNVLINNNYKTGVFTSPYLINFNERIKINNNDINNSDLLKLINFFYQFNNNLEEKLSFFEVLTLMSLKYFKEQNVDVILMEIGIGGRLDSTNILNYDLTIITSIGLDHINVLGNTKELITIEKLGALKENGFLITHFDELLNDIFINTSNNLNAKYKLIKSDEYNDLNLNLSLKGLHQVNNAKLAYYAIKTYFKLENKDIIKYLNETTNPGRLEELTSNVYIDGAHNDDAIKALIKSINYLFKNKKIKILFSALKDKDIKQMLNLLSNENYEIILTNFPDFRFKSLKEYESLNIKYLEDGILVFNNLINNLKEDEILIATGSIHFIGYLKKEYLKII